MSPLRMVRIWVIWAPGEAAQTLGMAEIGVARQTVSYLQYIRGYVSWSEGPVEEVCDE